MPKENDYDPAVVNLYHGYIPGGELDFSVRHSDGSRATYGFTAGGNYLHSNKHAGTWLVTLLLTLWRFLF